MTYHESNTEREMNELPCNSLAVLRLEVSGRSEQLAYPVNQLAAVGKGQIAASNPFPCMESVT